MFIGPHKTTIEKPTQAHVYLIKSNWPENINDVNICFLKCVAIIYYMTVLLVGF